MDTAFDVKHRDVSLIIRSTDGCFQATLIGAVSMMATLQITLQELNQMIDQVRHALREIVRLGVGPRHHEDLASGGVLHDTGHQAAVVVADAVKEVGRIHRQSVVSSPRNWRMMAAPWLVPMRAAPALSISATSS